MAYEEMGMLNATIDWENISNINNSTGEPLGEFDTSEIKYPGEYKYIPIWQYILKIAFYATIIILSLVGNTLVVYVVFRIKRMRTSTNYFIVNLAISDLMVTSSCTWVHLVDNLTEGWVLGAFFCKFNSFAQVLSLVSSILTLTLISCDRFFGIIFAMKAHVTERRSHLLIILTWIAAIGISSPLLVFRQQLSRQWLDHLEVWCEDAWPVDTSEDPQNGALIYNHTAKTFYFTFISVVLYFLPIAIMSIAYSLIMWKLWSNKIPGERLESEVRNQTRVKKKVIIMLVILLMTFAICWLPFQVANLYSTHRSNKTAQLPHWYDEFNFFANYIAFANSAFNPFIYTGFNSNFRRGFKTLLCCTTRRQRPHYNAVNAGFKRDSSMAEDSSIAVTLCTAVTHSPRMNHIKRNIKS